MSFYDKTVKEGKRTKHAMSERGKENENVIEQLLNEITENQLEIIFLS